MKLVIDIPDAEYERIQALDWKNSSRWYSPVSNAIHNGTPLPKGHGDLVDRDKVIDLLNEQEYNYYTELDKVVDTVYEADAIIEADKKG